MDKYWESTLLAGGQGGNTGGNNDGASDEALFSSPAHLVVAEDGYLYVADAGNNAVRQVHIASGNVSTLVSNASVNNPHGIVSDGAGNLYVGNFGNSSIIKINISNRQISTYSFSGIHITRGLAISGRFLYWLNTQWHQIFRVDIDNGMAAQQYPAGGWSYPLQAVVEGGFLYVNGAHNCGVFRTALDSGTTTMFVGGTEGSADGIGTSAQFYANAWGLTTDGEGNLYVTDAGRIRKIQIATRKVTTITTIGTSMGSLMGIHSYNRELYVTSGHRIFKLTRNYP
jgi:sugar lactone lactonase YvrE